MRLKEESLLMKPFEQGRPTLELSLPFEDAARRRFFGPLTSVLERLLFSKLDEFYAEVARQDHARHFIERILETLNVSYELAKDDLAQIPAKGRLLVLANHPFGMVDGVILASILRSVRPDFKILANASLNRITELCDTLIHVDPYGKSESIKANSRSIREAIAWLRSGGALGVFPAGEVAHIDFRKREVTDPEWRASVARQPATGAIDGRRRCGTVSGLPSRPVPSCQLGDAIERARCFEGPF
jgi:acyltransferase-like protein